MEQKSCMCIEEERKGGSEIQKGNCAGGQREREREREAWRANERQCLDLGENVRRELSGAYRNRAEGL